MSRKIYIPKKTLQRLYWKKHQSSIKIANIFGCDPMTIRNRMKEYDIPLRTGSNAHMKYPKHDFSGNQLEAAYLLGFRVGDLNVYQKNTNSELVIARCNTTQRSQIALVKRLFGRYGQITASKGRYSTNINCYLNLSFRFLLPKTTIVPDKIKTEEKQGWAFIAGYVDAEGNFILNQNRARFKVDSYDYQILDWMATWLAQRGIKTKFRRIATGGVPTWGGRIFKHDFWRLNINEAGSLLRFVEGLMPYIQHSKRRFDMRRCQENIAQRSQDGTIKN